MQLLILLSLKLRQYRFCLPALTSPTYYNLAQVLQQLGWRRSRFQWRADFSERNLQFALRAAEYLEFKHLLARLVAHYCPEVMPITYCINDHNYPLVLAELAEQYYRQQQQPVDKISNLVWILKPALLNNGQHIKLFTRLSDLRQHFLSAKRMGGEHVLQQYIAHPHLLNGHKYSIRLFVIITNYAGAYLYQHGYFNVANSVYQAQDFADLRSHLTNEHLREDESNVTQIPTQRCDFFAPIYRQTKNIVSATINGLRQLQPEALVCTQSAARTMAIFGYDFLVDADLRVWLLEVNHGPCFPTHEEHVLQKYLYHEFWQAVANSFVIPIAAKLPPQQIDYQYFDAV